MVFKLDENDAEASRFGEPEKPTTLSVNPFEIPKK
jgi:hypothetical protein